MDDLVSSLILPENIDDFLTFSPIPLDIFGEECNQTTLFGIQNDTVVGKVPKRKAKVASSRDGGEIDHKKKKTMHRDFERQRRQEMSALYRSLRSLMPHDYLKGRSVADHIQGVVSYIQQMQKRIECLHKTRDNLRKTLNSETFTDNMLNLTNDSIQIFEVTKTGLQVIVNTSLSGGVPLSKVLNALNREGLNVISSTSTISNEKMLHVIESQGNEGIEINVCELQNKLTGNAF